MDAERRQIFEHARRFERELNARQREVLERLADGQTNAQIASDLDLTFDGAKWNVSEILSKLGLRSREEAAEYWRWRQGSRVGPVRRALWPVAALAAGGLAVAVAFVAVLALTRGSDPPRDVQPFRMEWTDIYQSGLVVRSTGRTERLDSEHGRTEMVHMLDTGERRTLIIVDDTWAWIMVAGEETYQKQAILRATDSDGVPVPGFQVYVGPLPDRDIGALLKRLRRRPDTYDPNTPQFARVTGQDTVLGLPVTVIEFGPLSNDGSPERRASGQTIKSQGLGRVWVDPETMFVLRYEADWGGGQSRAAEATSLEFDPTFAPGTFTFVPEPGMTEATPFATPDAPTR